MATGSRIKLARVNLLRDALENTSAASLSSRGGSVDYARGVVLGCVSTVMAFKNCDFDAAFFLIKENLPADYVKETIPVAWWDKLGE